MAHDVFISYASGDKAVADAACATLESHGIRCWIAPRDVLPGIHYGEAIIDAIHECRIMVLVFSSKANLSGHIPKEIERAVSQGVTVMPLRIEDVAPAKSLDYFIGGVHWLDALTPPLEAHLERLAANVQTLLSRNGEVKPAQTNPGTLRAVAPPPVLASSPRAAPRSAGSTWAFYVIGGLTALVLILGYFTYRSKAPGNTASAPGAASAPALSTVASPVAAPEKPKAMVAPVSTAGPAAASAGVSAHPSTSAATSSTPSAAGATPAPAHAKPRREATLRYIPGSSTKLEQLIGDEDKETHKPTVSQTFTRFGIEGTALGSPFEHQGHLYFLFAATVGRLPRFVHTIATTDATNPDNGVRLDFLTNGGSYLGVEPTGTTMLAMDAPAGGISLDGQMYVAASTNFKAGRDQDRSVLTKFTAPSTFQTLRTISQLPDGRFIRMSIHAQPGNIAGLPDGGPYIFIWGIGKYRESDAYLSIVPASQFESGKGTRYFAGLNASNAPTWSDNESDASPLVKDGTLGDLSVTWCKELGLWLMAYDRRTLPDNGIALSYSRTPWGPWSEPQLLFNPNRDHGFGKFIHNPRRKNDDGLAGPVMRLRKESDAAEISGGAYAPFVVERWIKVQGSELQLYYLMSTGNPYVVVLMKSRLQIE